MKSVLLLIASGALYASVLAQGPPQPEDTNVKGTALLDHDKPISGFWGQTFLKQNIPYIDIPNSNIQEVYYYRWSAIQRHLRYVNPGTGYMQTEFMQPVSYAQAFGSIDAAAGHQIDEARWLRSRYFDDDYISLFSRGPGNSSQYTQWIIDAAYRRSQATGDTDFTTSQLDSYVRMWELWDYTFDETPGLYYFTTEWDAQEFSLPGYVMPNPETHPDAPEYGGPNTYRPSHNAYMYANALAIEKIAREAANQGVANSFATLASNLEKAIYQYIWNDTQQFFVDVIKPNNPTFAGIDGREEVGFYPYRFGIGLTANYSNPAISQLFDSEGFYAPWGPTTLERRNKFYNATQTSCCHWNGQSWPYSTAHTLKAMAMMYRSNNTNMTADQYYEYISQYATVQHKDGAPYVAESHYPEMDTWSSDSFNHSENYDHSTFCDDVITGLLGVVPQSDNTFVLSPIIPKNWTYFALENLPYKSHLISVFYDSSTSSNRYKQDCKNCLTIYVDGSVAYQKTVTSPAAKITLPDESSAYSKDPIAVNIAANPVGISNQLTWPRASASYTWKFDSPWKANDGALFYDSEPDNRWSNYDSPNNGKDNLTIAFPRPRKFNSVTLAIYSDVDRNGSVDVPASVDIHGDSSTGLIMNAGSSFVANDRNTFTFNRTVKSSEINIVFTSKSGKSVALCELEVWVAPPTPGPDTIYYAVDAYVVGATTIPTDSSNVTSAQPYVTEFSDTSSIMFSGIMLEGSVAKQGATLTVLYQNTGSSTASMEVNVNAVDNVAQLNLQQANTNGTVSSQPTVTAQVDLGAGKNFITLSGGSSDVRIFGIQVS